jgi:putative hydrolase of the HAD superfamily
MSRFEVVLFDFDGTLADSVGLMWGIYQDLLKTHGIQGALREFDELNGATLPEIAARLKARHVLSCSVERLLEQYRERIANTYATAVLPALGATDLLQCLSDNGIRVGLVTSSERSAVNVFLSRHQWDGFFEAMICAEDFARGKPNPDPYLKALERLRVHASSTLAVEDSENGVRSARAAGIETLWIGPQGRGDPNLIAGLDEVLNFIR